jgi:hypothetical protein
MVFTKQDVSEVVRRVLVRMVGDKAVDEIDNSTDPIRGLGLLSHDGLDFACDISAKLGFRFPDDQNPFVDDSGNRPRRVGEIIDLIYEMVSTQAEVTHGRT